MALLITPWQLSVRSDLYYQIGSMISAGLRLREAVETLAAHPPSFALRRPLARLAKSLAEGNTFVDAISRSGKWITSFDIALLEAGERSGRLDQCLKILSNYYREQATLMQSVMGSLAYPVCVIHLALLIFPIDLFTGLILKSEVTPFVLAKGLTFGVIYAAVFGVLYACQPDRPEAWRAVAEKVLRKIPVLGGALRKIAIARLATSLEALIAAGVSIFDAWELSAAASGSPQIKRAVLAWRPDVESGTTPAEAVAASGVFPTVFTNLYHTSEVTGQQEDTLKRINQVYYEEGLRGLKAFTKGFPFLVLLVVALYVGWTIIKFYSNYFGQLNKIGM
jgi:type II secretory pathway component PulF